MIQEKQEEKEIAVVEPYIYSFEEDGERVVHINPEYEKIRKRKRYLVSLTKSGIPDDYWDLEFENYSHKFVESKEELQKCIRYARECQLPELHDISLYLHSESTRSGKTTVACCIGKEFLRQELKVKYFQAGDLIRKLMNFESYEETVSDLDHLDLAIIDDAFDPKKSIMWKNSADLIISAWDTFIRTLISRDIRIVFTSNIPLSQILSTYGKSLYELLKTNAKVLEFRDNLKSERERRLEAL